MKPKPKRKKQLSLKDALLAVGVNANALADVIAQGLRGKNALKAADMAMKVRGDYKINYVVSGQINHAHAHANIQLPDEETARRLRLLRDREKRDMELRNAVDVIVTPIEKK